MTGEGVPRGYSLAEAESETAPVEAEGEPAELTPEQRDRLHAAIADHGVKLGFDDAAALFPGIVQRRYRP